MKTNYKLLAAAVAASFLSLAAPASGDARIKLTVQLYCESPPRNSPVSRVEVVNTAGGRVEIKAQAANPYYFSTFVSNLRSHLNAPQGGEATIEVHASDPKEFFILPSEGVKILLNFQELAFRVNCYDKKNYLDRLIDSANSQLDKKNRQAVVECQDTLAQIERLELDTAITLARLRTKRLDALMDADAFQDGDEAIIDEWLEKACFGLADRQPALVSEFVSAIVYSTARTRKSGWLKQGGDILKRAVTQGIEPKYGAGDLWDALNEAGRHAEAFRVAYGASEHFLDRNDAQNVRWFRRAITALQRWKNNGGGNDVPNHAAELRALLNHRIGLATPEEQGLLRPMLAEIEMLTSNLP